MEALAGLKRVTIIAPASSEMMIAGDSSIQAETPVLRAALSSWRREREKKQVMALMRKIKGKAGFDQAGGLEEGHFRNEERGCVIARDQPPCGFRE